MSSKEKLPDKLTLKKCGCGHVGCDTWRFKEGIFYQGSGFSKRVAKEVARRYNIYNKKNGK